MLNLDFIASLGAELNADLIWPRSPCWLFTKRGVQKIPKKLINSEIG
jgi:hypothetical protein